MTLHLPLAKKEGDNALRLLCQKGSERCALAKRVIMHCVCQEERSTQLLN